MNNSLDFLQFTKNDQGDRFSIDPLNIVAVEEKGKRSKIYSSSRDCWDITESYDEVMAAIQGDAASLSQAS